MTDFEIPIEVDSDESVSARVLPPELSVSASSVTPRAGGYMKNLQIQDLNEVTPRSKTLNDTLQEKPFIFKKSEARVPECDDMLAVSISCVMMLASNAENIPDEYFVWTDNYLSRIKDENGKYPPNVKGILNHIALVRSDIPSPEVVTCRCSLYDDQGEQENKVPMENSEDLPLPDEPEAEASEDE
ncbi:hypothetical protein FQR65_LT08068 [Abscondita terminalis]|nr:hypothetical protein FQR65_LT08068 [Abscondita terminalis]